MLHLHRRRTGLALVLGLAPFICGAARAEEAPPQIGHPIASANAEETESIQVPAIPFDGVTDGQRVSLLVRTAPIIDPRDRGSEFTDGGYGRAIAALTAAEAAKLAMARAAVEAALAAGVLPMRLREDLGPALTEEEIQQAKMRRLAEARPAQSVPDPASGIGAEIPSVQLEGPPTLNEIELAKLAGQELPSVPPDLPPTPETRKEVE